MDNIKIPTFAPVATPNLIGKMSEKKTGDYIFKNIEEIGGGKKTTWERFSPLIDNIIKIVRSLILIVIIMFATMDIYKTIGCKAQYIRLNSKSTSQQIIFLTIFLLVFILSAETINPMMGRVISFGKMFFAAIIVWILFNIITQAGETWAFFSSPFWPGPLTFWGVILLFMCSLYVIDIIKQYWQYRKEKIIAEGAPTQNYIVTLETIEKGIIGILICLIGYGYYQTLMSEKKRLKNKFSFYNFVFNRIIETKNPKKTKIWQKARQTCSKKTVRGIQKEIATGIKNSWWHKLWN